MKVAIIGRTEMLYKTVLELKKYRYCIVAIITSKASPEYQVDESDFKKLSEDIGCDYFFTNNINQKNLIDYIKDKKVDIGISVNCINIIEQELIDAFKIGILNSHAGNLPRYRGNACPNWAIINGEDYIALTIHYMEGGKLDSGDIVAQDKYYLDNNMYIGDIYGWIRKTTPELFLSSLRKIASNPDYILKEQPDKPEDILRCYPRIPSDSQINWQLPAEYIHRIIRASSEPFSGAYTYFEGKKFTIWRADLYHDNENYLAVPGQIAFIDKDKGDVVVITGEGKLKISLVSFLDADKVKPAAIIKSFRKRLGQ